MSHLTDAELLDHLTGEEHHHAKKCSECTKRLDLLGQGDVAETGLAALRQAAAALATPPPDECDEIPRLLDAAEALLNNDPEAARNRALSLRASVNNHPTLAAVHRKLLIARTYKIESHAYRLTGRFTESIACLSSARQRVLGTPAGDYELAVLDFCEAVIRRETGELAAATLLLNNARRIFERYGDQRRSFQARLLEGAIHFRELRYERAAHAFREVSTNADDEETRARAALNLAHALLQTHHLEAATTALQHARTIFAARDMHTESTRASWLHARIMLASGDVTNAAKTFSTVVAEFDAYNARVDAALAQLDLAQALLLLADESSAREHVARALETFGAANLPDRARAALAYLHELVRNDALTPQAAEHVREYVQLLPSHPFTP